MNGLSSTTLAVIAASAVAFAATWRFAVAFRVRSVVASALRDPDPVVRARGVRQAGEVGLATMSRALLRLAQDEQSPAVLQALTRVVAERQWEPASSAALVELRLWAKAYLDSHPEFRSPNGTDAPLLPGVAGAAIVPSLDPARASRFQRGSDAEPVDAPAPREWDRDALARTRVLVTGAGGPAGIAVIRELRARGHVAIGADCDPLATGLRLAEEGHVLPRSDDPAYVAALVRAASVSNAQALICTVAEEYAALNAGRPFLTEAGIRTLLPTTDATNRCADKWRFHQVATAAGVPVPATALGSDIDAVITLSGPWVVKPRFGRGSRDVTVCRTDGDLATALNTVPDPVVQTLVEGGREFSSDALVDADGSFAGCAMRWRGEVKAGISVKGETFVDDDVAAVTAHLLAAVGLVGPANVQGFVRDDGSIVVIEVNPRFSGALPLSLHAGADLVEEYLRAVMGRPLRPERLVARPGVRMLRHFVEVFEETSTPVFAALETVDA